MRKLLPLALLTAVAVLAFALVAGAAPDRTIKLSASATTAEWDGTATVAANQTFVEGLLNICGKTPIDYCEETLIEVDAATAKLKVDVDGFGLPDDFDLVIYKSDASGAIGDEVGNSGEIPGTVETATIPVTKGFYVVRVIYYLVLNSAYHGKVTLSDAKDATPGTTPAPGTTPTPGSTPVPGATPAPTPTPAPAKPGELPTTGTLTISAAADKGKRATARKRGLRVRLRCSVQCKATVAAAVDAKTAKRLKLGKTATKIGSGSATISKPGRIPFFAKLTPKAKKALAKKKVKKFKVFVTINVTDLQGGQLKKFSKAITLR